MKRTEFIRRINGLGCELLRHGNRHDIYININNGKRAPIPRHKEIADTLKITTGTTKSNLARARMILKEKVTTHKATLNSQLS